MSELSLAYKIPLMVVALLIAIIGMKSCMGMSLIVMEIAQQRILEGLV